MDRQCLRTGILRVQRKTCLRYIIVFISEPVFSPVQTCPLLMMHDTCCGKSTSKVALFTHLIITMCSPETVESLFIAYRLTGDQLYRDHGWKIFQAIEKHCRIESGGYVTIINVDESPARQEDKMETFFLVCFYLCDP